MTTPGPSQLEGMRIDGRYLVGRKIGQGGMGSVFRARQEKLDRNVVIKVLHTDLIDQENYAARFAREARAASTVQHQNIVEVIDFGELPTGEPYLVMESLEGEDLCALLTREHHLGWSRTRGILLQVIAALGAAHEHGVLHRDIKPSNCFLVADRAGTPGDFVKLLDFGIATFVDPERTTERLTDNNMVIGTTTYLAPELAIGKRASVATDIYATGVLAYEMLTGKVPFDDRDPYEILRIVQLEPVPRLREAEPSVPADAESLVLKALAKDPSERFESMTAFATAIQTLDVAGQPGASGRTGTVFSEAQSKHVPQPRTRSRKARPKPQVTTMVPGPRPPESDGVAGKRRLPMLVFAGLLAAGLTVVGTLLALRYAGGSGLKPSESSPAPSTVAAPQNPTPLPHAPPMPAADEPQPSPPPGVADTKVAEPASSDPTPPVPEQQTPAPPAGTPSRRPKRAPAAPKTDASAKARIQRNVARKCASAGSGTVGVKFSVGSDGRLKLIRVDRRLADTELGKCVGRIVRSSRYPPGSLRAFSFDISIG